METLPDVTDTELAILRLLWDHGPSTIRKLTELLYGSGTTSHYATVQKLLDRLESKGFVARDRSSMVHVFRPLCSRDAYIGGQLRTMADKLCGGSLAPLLTNLLHHERLTAEQRRELRSLLGQIDRSKGKAGSES